MFVRYFKLKHTMSLDALESIVARCCTALEPHHPADILITDYAITASRRALLYPSYHVGRYARPGEVGVMHLVELVSLLATPSRKNIWSSGIWN